MTESHHSLRSIPTRNPFASPIWYVESCSSTMDLALDLARTRPQDSPHGTLVQTGFQSRGRGRHHGRQWKVDPGQGFLSTTILRHPSGEILENPGQISLRAALALGRLLEDLCGLAVEIKWPNDLLFRGQKLAGILVEGPGSGLFLLGMGLNLDRSGKAGSAQTGAGMHTRKDEAGQDGTGQGEAGSLPPLSLREALEISGEGRDLPSMEDFREAWLTYLFASLADPHWKTSVEFRLAYKKRMVQLILGQENSSSASVTGVLLGINKEGRARIMLNVGNILESASGSIRLLPDG